MKTIISEWKIFNYLRYKILFCLGESYVSGLVFLIHGANGFYKDLEKIIAYKLCSLGYMVVIPLSDYLIRTKLNTLKCWHLEERDKIYELADNLIRQYSFYKNSMIIGYSRGCLMCLPPFDKNYVFFKNIICLAGTLSNERKISIIERLKTSNIRLYVSKLDPYLDKVTSYYDFLSLHNLDVKLYVSSYGGHQVNQIYCNYLFDIVYKMKINSYE